MNSTVTFKDTPVHLQGEMPKVGEMAPDFTAVASDLSEVTLHGFRGKCVLLNIFPSLDTAVCAASVRKFNQKAAAMPDVHVWALSMDLPFAQSRFCTTEGIDRVTPLSLFRSDDFTARYGLLMADGPLAGLTARAVLAIDEAGKIIYTELVPEITQEPDYEAALQALANR